MRFSAIALCATALAGGPAFAQSAPAAPAPTPGPTAGAPAGEDDAETAGSETVVVRGVRERGAIPADVEPTITIGQDEIAGYGASNLNELLAAIAPQTGSARGRGGGPPVILLNGRRVSGFAELRFVPPEAIQRIEVFPEDVAVIYGFAPDQRVVNLVLRQGFRALTLEAGGGGEADGNRSTVDLEATVFSVGANGRSLINLEQETSTRVTEADLGVRTVAIPQLRSLLPEETERRVGLNFNRGLGERHSVTFDLRQESIERTSLLGPTSTGTAIVRAVDTLNTRGAVTFDGANFGWQWTATGVADTTIIETATSSGPGASFTSQVNDTLEASFNATGTIIDLPAGGVRTSFRFTARAVDIGSRSLLGGVVSGTELDRDEQTLRANVTIPLTSRNREVLPALGTLSLSLNGTLQELSDAGTLSGSGATLSWSPADGWRFSATVDHSENAPGVQQLGAPLNLDPDAEFFDFVRGVSRPVALVSGGNGALRPEQRDDFTFNASYSPPQLGGAVSIQASYVRNESTDPISSLPTGFQGQQAFPGRFTRNGAGDLTGVDIRPVNLARTTGERVRWGFFVGIPIGPMPPGMGGRPGGAGGQPGGPPQAGQPQAGQTQSGQTQGGRPQGGPPQGGPQQGGPQQGGPPQAGRPGGAGGGPGGGGGRPGGRMEAMMMGMFGQGPGANLVGISLFHTYRIEETVQLVPGGPVLNLLEGDALGSSGGVARNTVEIETGISYKGLGLRLAGTWDSGSTVVVPPSPGVTGSVLTFDPYANLGLRGFVNFDARPELIEDYPFLRGSRLFMRIDNLSGTARGVRDQNGVTPLAFQDAFANPRGTSWEIGWRKQLGPSRPRATEAPVTGPMPPRREGAGEARSGNQPAGGPPPGRTPAAAPATPQAPPPATPPTSPPAQ